MSDITYYEIKNTTSEYSSSVSARWQTLEQAKADMVNHADWFDKPGTGVINKVTITSDDDGRVTIETEKVYDNR